MVDHTESSGRDGAEPSASSGTTHGTHSVYSTANPSGISQRQPGGTTSRPSGLFNMSTLETALPSVSMRRRETTMLTEDNFGVWKWHLKYNLKAIGLYDCLINPQLTSQEQRDVAMFEIISTISDRVKLRVAHCKDPKTLFESIESLYTNKTSFMVTDLHMKLTSFKFKSSNHISEGLSYIVNIVSKLKNLNQELSDHMVEGVILAALPGSFRTFITVWKGLPANERTIGNLTNRLLAEVEDDKIFNGSKNNKVFYTKQEKRPNSHFKQNFKKFNKQDGRNKKNIKKKAGNCNYCKKPGHWSKECRKRISEESHNGASKEQKSEKDKSNGKHQVFMAIQGKVPEGNWIIDSGATSHMSSKRQWFQSYEQFVEPMAITIGNGNTIQAYGFGSIKTNVGTLTNVLYVPKLAANLFSIQASLEQGLNAVMDSSRVTLMRGDEAILQGELEDGLYLLKLNVLVDKGQSIYLARTCHDWHKRFGHVNNKTLFEMEKNKVVDGFKLNQDPEEITCKHCLLNKGTKASHPARTTVKTSQPGACLHIDTAGPMREEGILGERFFLLAKDEATSYKKVACIEKKSEISSIIKKLINDTEYETGQRVLRIVSDNGSEFVNGELGEFLSQRGIVHECSTPYTPQQNGFIERDMRTIGESSRTMLNESGLPRSLWAQAVQTAVYVNNRVINSRNSDKTPYELWFKKKPNVKNLRIFGQLAVINRPVYYREGKWDLTGDLVRFAGYTSRDNTYRFYNPNNGDLTSSCDVTFIDKDMEPEIIGDNELDKILNSVEDVVIQPARMCFSDEVENTPMSPLPDIETTPEVDVNNLQDSETSYSSCDDTIICNEASGLDDQSLITEEISQAIDASRIPRNLKIHGKHPEILAGRTRSQNYANLAVLDDEPFNFKDAMKRKDKAKWLEAMQDEINSLAKNKTWVLVDRPVGKNVVTNKWVMRIKQKASRIRGQIQSQISCQRFLSN